MYNSWGEVISLAGSHASDIGTLNPFRYRGYVYDEETGLYYLQSRYYDPELCRFISSDVLLSTGQGVLGHNAYAYCGNNPVSRADDEGQFWHIIAGAVAGAVIGAASSAIKDLKSGNSINFKAMGVAAAWGAAGGALTAVGLPAAASIAVGAVIGAASDASDQLIRNKKIDDVTSVVISGVAGGVGAAFGGSGALKDLHADKYVKSQNQMLKNAISHGKPLVKALQYTLSQTNSVLKNAAHYEIKRVAISSFVSELINGVLK